MTRPADPVRPDPARTRDATPSAPTETPAQRYARVHDEHYRLRRIHPDQRTPADRRALRTTADELAEILAVPPTGYSLPPAATALIRHARDHGWQAIVQWYPPPGPADTDAEPSVRVCVGRRLTAAEDAEYHRSDTWAYTLTWHSRGCPPGRLRLFGQGLAETPAQPATHGAPSIRAITAVITAHSGSSPA